MLDFLQKTSKEPKENFWSLLIEPQWVSSAVWEIEDGKVKVISKSPSTRWESDLLGSIDTSLSSCMQNLPEDVPDPSKTVFGVPSTWIEEGNIKPEHLDILKKICDSLSLVPSGFVVLSEAISHYVKYEEETALTGITLGVSDQNLELSIFNLGALVGVTNISRSLSVEDDLAEGLARLSPKLNNFPARIILYNQKEQELEEILETLNNSDWTKIGNSKFMHTPKVEIFDPEKKISAVSLAGGSELGAVGGISSSPNREEVKETVVNELPIEELDNVEEPEGITAEDLGFVTETPKEPMAINIPKLPEMPQFKKPNFKLPTFKLPKIKFALGTSPFIIGGVGLLTFLIVAFLMWWFLPTATVTVYVSPKKIEENVSVKLDSDLKTNEVKTSVTGEKTKSTTGTKTVGEKAKGQVKVQNGTAFPINLPAGSTLLSSSELKFVTVSSASVSGALSPSNPGTSTIEVEAVSIGSEYNLNKDEVFKVANYPKAEVDATSTDSFTGGSSRQISSVSEDDRKSLLNDLKEELTKEAQEKLNSQLSDSEYLIDSSMESKLDEENFSNKVGDEATSVKLSLTMTVTALSLLKDDLTNLTRKALEDKVPQGFILRDDQMSYEFDSTDEGFDVKVLANLLPSNNPTEIAKKIAGRYPAMAESYLSSVPGFVKAEFKFKYNLPGKLGTLPHVPKNINVEFSADK